MAYSLPEKCPYCGNIYPDIRLHKCRMAMQMPVGEIPPVTVVECPKCNMKTVDFANHVCNSPTLQYLQPLSKDNPFGEKVIHDPVRGYPEDQYLKGIENRKSPYAEFQQEFPMSERTYLGICQQQFNDHMAEVGRLSSRMAVRPLDFAVVSSLVVHMNQAQSALTKMQGILGEQEYKKS